MGSTVSLGVGPDDPLDITGPDARAAVLHPDRREPGAAPHPPERPLGRLPKPPGRCQDRDGAVPMTLDVASQALTLGLALGFLLGPARGHRVGPLRGPSGGG